MTERCIKHRRKAIAKWHICSVEKWEPVCKQCDLELNKAALIWRYPKTWRRRFEAYKARVNEGMTDAR